MGRTDGARQRSTTTLMQQDIQTPSSRAAKSERGLGCEEAARSRRLLQIWQSQARVQPRYVFMKTALYGRIFFGASAVLFGAICLMWHDPYTWQSLSKIWSLPFGTAIGAALMAAQVAGGVALPFPRSARLASIVLGVVYLLFSLACVPAIVAAPKVFGEWDGFFEQFCMLSGAVAVYAATDANVARAISLGRFARIGLGLCTVSFTLAQAIYFHGTAQLVPTWIPPSQNFWAMLTTVAFALAAIAILLNLRARMAMRLLTLMVILFGVLVWIPLLIAHPAAHINWSEFALTMLIAGSAWAVADLSAL